VILSCFTVAFMAANPLFGAISRSDDRRAVLALASVIGLAGVVWIALAPGFLPFAAVAFVAFGAGGAFTLSMTLPLDDAATDAEATAWNAFVMLVSYVVGAAGPLLVGVLRDATGDFAAPIPCGCWSGRALRCSPRRRLSSRIDATAQRCRDLTAFDTCASLRAHAAAIPSSAADATPALRGSNPLGCRMFPPASPRKGGDG
jgi:MFS family permease